jgi:integrase/recombinase XerD
VTRWREDLAPSTTFTKRKTLARFLRALVKSGAPEELLVTLARVREPAPRATTASPDEIARLQVTACAWEKCMLAIIAGLGLRRTEALRLSPANYDRETDTITYRTKGDQTNKLPVTDELRAFFHLFGDEIENPNTPILELMRGKKVTKAVLADAWASLRTRARINPQLRMHDLRRTVAHRLYDETHDLRVVQRLLGHADMSTTLKYLRHHDPENLGNLQPLLNKLRVTPVPDWKN